MLKNRILWLLICSLFLVAACAPSTPAVQSTAVPPAPTQVSPSPTLVSPIATFIPPTATPIPPTSTPAKADLGSIKTYLLSKAGELKKTTVDLKAASDRYYGLAQAAKFDYATLWKNQKTDVTKAIEQARAAWVVASPLYEQMEGIVAGVPSLADYDTILDSGASGSEGGKNVVPFDLKLPNGKTLPKPGNLFGVTESALWGTETAYRVPKLWADFNGNGKQEFGESLPDANILKAAAETMDKTVGELQGAAQAWQPSESDAFTALVVMVPTMIEYFESWKNSRFIAGDQSDQRDFVIISRLADIQDILASLQVVYKSVSPLVNKADSNQDAQIAKGLGDLRAFIADVYAKEKGGKKFTAEDADLLGSEAQNRATAITGQITQMAAKLQIKIQ